MRGKAALSAFPRVFLAAIGYLRDSDNEMGGRQDAQNPLNAGDESRLRSLWDQRIIYGREIGTCVS